MDLNSILMGFGYGLSIFILKIDIFLNKKYSIILNL